MDFTSLLRPHIASMEPYTPILPFDVLSRRLGREPRDIVKLDANENPYGPSPQALRALADLQYAHIYPDPENTSLRLALAQHLGLPMENLFAGSGADELIDLVMRAFLEPGDVVVNCPPSFGMYPFDAAVNAATVANVPRRKDFSVDVPAIEELVQSGARPRPKLLFIASPNNPDGSWLPDPDLRRLVSLPVMVVLDEAYVEFCGPDASRMSWVWEHDNVIVLRTFSKRAGLAGLRVGYGAFPMWLMPHLWKIKQPYNVSVAATAAAIASLGDIAYLDEVVRILSAERERLAEALSEIPYLRPYPSRSNFILCRVVGRDARDLKLALERDGILVRYYTTAGLSDCIRISVGKPEHTDVLLDAFRRI